MYLNKEEFIRFAIKHNVLKFGKFTLKSGRQSPYFFNAGLFYTGSALRQLGQFYAQLILDHCLDCKHLFGPAYKGLPLATAVAIALAEYHVETEVTFNRKEVKNHGEQGQLIGSPLSGNTVMVDDVITAGTAFREAKNIIHSHGGKLTAVVIALDRCERGLTKESTVKEIQAEGIEVYSIITIVDLIDYLQKTGKTVQAKKFIDYQSKYGA